MSTDAALIENVLLAACFPDPDTPARVASIGADDIAAALLAELASRAALLNAPTDGLVIQCDLGFVGGRLGYLLSLGNGDPTVEKGWDSQAGATVR